ncbi:hypothetical protein IMCC3317_43800 [Kordia antarctica]|uniref:Uncharacterized protein n=1 Tax=Kordia antarctica TaxID=1218801 RepID=A0A7L4ZR73_9FLAO|nr:hypothetical protein [Kordia antarctica]QHI38980.1 hypothetical protein IMCC3317_43800 [Kordia antarctica]
MSEKPGPSSVFQVTLFIAAIIFIVFMNKIEPFSSFGFWKKVLVFIVTSFTTMIIYAIATSIITAIYKALIEIVVVILILFNAIFIDSIFYGITPMFDNNNSEGVNIFTALLTLLILDIIIIIVLLPLARIAKSNVFDKDFFD